MRANSSCRYDIDYRELDKGIGRFRELLRVIEFRSTQSLRQVTNDVQLFSMNTAVVHLCS